ncbi:hypothetical protein C8F04DRAFT_1067290 [Mycena alexandri]|uniref:Uncharacterized protein n=1 Tax=Mycena alexandri TaxID=1745969 RepID=A0AAD6XE56_9AGAR|nr:hypothetical protein C8F04DRAFT_1067290 [Mycena alexandri]
MGSSTKLTAKSSGRAPIPRRETHSYFPNISAETLSSTVGPRGRDKLIVSDRGDAQMTNYGATILKFLDIVRPAARTLVDIARTQDAEVGDIRQASQLRLSSS